MGSIADVRMSVDSILPTLTLEEKISLLAGKNFWETADIPAKRIPSLKTSDGPNGVRGATFREGITAACFPASILLASTWDLNLARRVGKALAEEARTKGARVVLAPTVCPHRHPLGGRNFESFSEDPLLAGRLAAEYIRGLQENGVGAAIKHFAANEQETDRFTVNATISQRALREIYLKPFEIAIKEAQPWAVMTSYNLVNGQHSDMNEYLLKRVLRGDWGWKGLVVSDWGGTNSTVESINAGLDLEMPGPTQFRSQKAVQAAISSGLISEETINERCQNLLELLEKTGAFADSSIADEKAVNFAEHRALIREVGNSGIVLLKNNNGLLPLRQENLRGKKVALLGFAQEALIHGGGSASVNTHYKVTPWEGLAEALGPDVELLYSKGAHTLRRLPAMRSDVVDDVGRPGWTLRGFESYDYTGSLAVVQNLPNASWCPILEVSAVNSAVITGTYKPLRTGSHYLGVSGIGPSQLYINGSLVFDQTECIDEPMSFILGTSSEQTFQVHFEEGGSYRIEVRTFRVRNNREISILSSLIGFHLGLSVESEHDEDLVTPAVALAKQADVAIVFSGHTIEWESEGQDQKTFNLPAEGSQDRLIAAVSAVNPNVIVVNSTGTPVAMPWIDQVAAVVQSWFPGQESGNAVADVLTGASNPSGRLPVSFPRNLEDAPAFGNFPGSIQNGRREVHYAEDVYMGYRHYDREDPSKVLFPFGFGLSYTTFQVSGLKVRECADRTYDARVEVTNSGPVAGSHVVQIYVGPAMETKVGRPLKQLAGFKKVFLEPRETAEVQISTPIESLAYFDESKDSWVIESGDYYVFAASSAADIHDRQIVTVRDELVYAP